MCRAFGDPTLQDGSSTAGPLPCDRLLTRTQVSFTQLSPRALVMKSSSQCYSSHLLSGLLALIPTMCHLSYYLLDFAGSGWPGRDSRPQLAADNRLIKEKRQYLVVSDLLRVLRRNKESKIGNENSKAIYLMALNGITMMG